MSRLSTHPASWFSAAYHSNATRIIAFSFSCIVVTVQLGDSLCNAVAIHLRLSLGIELEGAEITQYIGLPIAFLGLVLRYCWLVWRRNNSIPRGIDLVLQIGEMGLVLWTWTKILHSLYHYGNWSAFYTVYVLYIPSALFLLVAKILDVVHSDGGMWLGLRAATRIVQPAIDSRVDRKSLTQSRVIVARIYLILIIGHTVTLGIFMAPGGVDPYSYVVNTYSKITVLVSLSVSLVHHLQRIFRRVFNANPSFFVARFLPRGLDFGLLLLEHLLLNFGQVNDLMVMPWPALVIMNVSERILISILLAFRIWDVVQYGSRPLEPFNLVPRYDIRSSRMSLLLGRNAWENLSLRGEPAIVKSLRGILASAALVGLGTFSVALISRDVSSSQDEVILKTFMLNNPRSLPPSHYILLAPTEDISASALIDNPELLNITQTCSPGDVVSHCAVCSGSWTPENSQNHSCWYCSDASQFSPSRSCQVQIQVDFGRGEEISRVFAGPAYNQIVYVGIAFSEIDNATFWKIPKATLRRNRALEGDAMFYQYEFLKKSRLTSMGFESSNQIIVGDVKSISNDPTYTIPNNLAYLRYRYSPRDNVVSMGVREYIDKTVLDALASIGGIWTFGNGLFTLVFGGSLLYFLLGLRPLSRFGFVHLFIRARLRQATREQYPNFHHEGGQPGEAEAGVVTFIRQHLLGVVEDDEEEEERKKRRREWERQRDEMELLSFDVVSGPLRSSPRHSSSGRYESLRQDDLERQGQEL
ncbi:hypothetical protein DL96DRAFT_1817069 [Flagelloscypha sp. PMI_526]|nr:hypothetical protein DL96DRAFT_1817069 [Flagelloscypha sp. PMI_526]